MPGCGAPPRRNAGSPRPSLIHDTLQPPGTRAPVSVHIAHQAIGRAQREVVTRDTVFPPVGLDAPFAHLLDYGVAMPDDDERDELTLVPDQLRGQRVIEQSHACFSESTKFGTS